MANSDFFSNMMGFSAKYAEISKTQSNDETDYEGVDFCQGEEIEDNQYCLFGDTETISGNNYNSDDCLFNFEAEIDDDLG